MPKITTHLWFDTQAREAGEFYTSVFDDSRVKSINTLHNTPSGDVDVVVIDVAGAEFTLISAGPLFKFNPSISFIVACATKAEVDRLWGALSKGGTALMELGAYPFSDWYGWVQDRYGVTWQIMFAGDRPIAQKITPVLMFTQNAAGRAEEAIRFYASVFHDSKVGDMMRYGAGEEPDREGTLKFARFQLEGQQFAAMDSAQRHAFTFNEAISLMVNCETQEEIDHYWERLSADPRAEQCGWLKDKFGVSWQVTSTEMAEMFAHGTPQQMARVTEAFLKMKKFDVAKLREAYEG